MFDDINNVDELTDAEAAALEKKLQARREGAAKKKEAGRRMLGNYSFDLGYCEATLESALGSLYDNPEWLEDYDLKDKLDEIETACVDLEGMISDLESLIDDKEMKREEE